MQTSGHQCEVMKEEKEKGTSEKLLGGEVKGNYCNSDKLTK
jgi:hypothetical protein